MKNIILRIAWYLLVTITALANVACTNTKQSMEAQKSTEEAAAIQQLRYAAREGELSKVRSLIASGVDVNTKRADGVTPLMLASGNGSIEVVRVMLAAGADVKVKSNDNDTALLVALKNNHVDVATALLDAGADVKVKRQDGMTALILAARNGSIDMVRRLLAAGVDVNAKCKDTNGNDSTTALIIAASHGSVELVRMLLGAGADVNAKGLYGATALYEATWNNHVDVVRTLIDSGANLYAKRGDDTALSLAMRSKYDEIARLLRDAESKSADRVLNNCPSLCLNIHWKNQREGIENCCKMAALRAHRDERINAINNEMEQRNPSKGPTVTFSGNVITGTMEQVPNKTFTKQKNRSK